MAAVSALQGPSAPPPDASLPAHGSHHTHDRIHRIADAAVEAELETGRREETVAKAKAHILVRIARMVLGFAVVIVGLLLLPLPGPGWLVIAAGFVVLAQDFVWAERTLARIRRRLPQDADGRVTKKTWVVIGASTTLTLTASVLWTIATWE